MFADCIVLRRLPRRFTTLTYRVPDTLIGDVGVGHFVTVPFRSQKVFAVIVRITSVRDADSSQLKDIDSAVYRTPLFSYKHIHFLESVSSLYGISLSASLTLLSPPLQKRKLLTQVPVPLPSDQLPGVPLESQCDYRMYTNHDERQSYIQSLPHEPTLVLVPEIYEIDRVYELLTDEQKKRAVVWHSGLSEKEQFARWWQIRNGEKTLVIGTRGAVFLTFPTLAHIVIDLEHHPEHKHWDQAPRYDTKTIATLLQQTYGARITYTSPTMSFSSYFAIKKHNLTVLPTGADIVGTQHGITCVDMRAERRTGNLHILSFPVEQALAETTGDVFFFLNRLGFASAYGCRDCGFIARCQTCKHTLIFHDSPPSLKCHYCKTARTPFVSCPNCRSTAVRLMGAGIERLESDLRKRYQHSCDAQIVRLDAQTEPYFKAAEQRIVIGTSFALPYVRWDKTQLVVCVDPDMETALPELYAQEDLYHFIRMLDFHAKADVALFVQTFHPEHLVWRAFHEPERLYRTDLSGRKSLLYPPYSFLVRYFYGNTDAKTARRHADMVCRKLKDALTQAGKAGIVHDPIEMQPAYYRRKFWYTILVKLPTETWQNVVPLLNTVIPDDWKIDPNPHSLLSP